MGKLVIGLDYGSDSVRALLLEVESGMEVSSAVHPYQRWASGRYCDPSQSQFRQHPLDYIEGLEEVIHEILSKAPAGSAAKVIGLSVDTTGSTPVAVDRNGTPLALHPEFAENPNAMFILWKDHTALGEAAEINALAKNWGAEDFTKYSGGIYSSEWFWAKILRTLRLDEKVRAAAYSWCEHCDWIPALLTGAQDVSRIKRSRCAAGHKAMWHPSWGGLPPELFLAKLDPLLAGIRERLYTDTCTADLSAGIISEEWAKRLGLPKNLEIGVGAFDAHMGAVGGQIEPYFLSKVMGTSTCDMMVLPSEDLGGRLVRGICGQVDGSIIPGMLGLEAGQSAFGDVYAWFRNILTWAIPEGEDKSRIMHSIIPALEREALKLDTGNSGVFAIDWLNGRRTPDANQALSGALLGLRLGTTAPMIYRALVESTVFGAKRIIDRFEEEGIHARGIIAMGGVAKKSPFIMQLCADVMGMPIRVVKSEQACALGAAMFAAVVGGEYKTVQEAIGKMGSGFESVYNPSAEKTAAYADRYQEYFRYAALIEKEIMREKK